MQDNLEKPQHEQLFDEICNKLQELSTKNDPAKAIEPNKAQLQLKRAQDELRHAHQEIQQKIKAISEYQTQPVNMQFELTQISDQLENERRINAKISQDLARSLELNLKLQFEIDDLRKKSQSVIDQERKSNFALQDAVRNQDSELKKNQTRILDLEAVLGDTQDTLTAKEAQIDEMEKALESLEEQSISQSKLVQDLTSVAEEKLIELKMNLDKKSAEAQDYFGRIQQMHTQMNILKQENSALKEYIAKISGFANHAPPAQGQGPRV